jgi:DNA-directed RNA polymerase sigma subunit (sigma70/sigma32)
MRKNFYGKIKESRENSQKIYYFDQSSLELIARDESGYEMEKRYFENQQVVKSLIEIMNNDTTINEKARIRFVKIVESYFGVNGQQKKGLNEIGKELGVSQERIRQLRDRAIQHMRRKAMQNGLKIEY